MTTLHDLSLFDHLPILSMHIYSSFYRGERNISSPKNASSYGFVQLVAIPSGLTLFSGPFSYILANAKQLNKV